MTTITLRPDFGCSILCGSVSGSNGLGLVLNRPRLLSSQKILVVRCHTQRASQTELGNIVLVEAADILTVGLRHGLLCLTDGQIVADAVGVALLGLAERLVGEVDTGSGYFDLLLGGGNVEQGVTHIGVDLGVLVAQLGT